MVELIEDWKQKDSENNNYLLDVNKKDEKIVIPEEGECKLIVYALKNTLLSNITPLLPTSLG